MRLASQFRMALTFAVVALVGPPARPSQAAGYTLVGWNNLGMHCMDGDYAVLSLLPPFNTIDAQLVDPLGLAVTDPAAAGITVTYEGIADADGSLNTTSIGKTNFWDHAESLFGAALSSDVGLFGFPMPGPANVPRPMTWDPSMQWFEATGIPITPYDDGGAKNPYPMMRLVARDATGAVLATTDVVLPVSDEMDCRSCHASGSGPAARPAAGWVGLAEVDPQRDMRFNILRLHDERERLDPAFQAALDAGGYEPDGLEATVTRQGRSILCASCHLSEALPGSGRPGILPLTQAIHGLHAAVTDPTTGLALEDSSNRSACYRCHPGSVTRCLRGAMGSAVSSDGTLAMQCQSCHGAMSVVAAPTRTGWLDEPACQSCHTGTAVHNAGAIRFTSVFDAPGHVRIAPDARFATNPDTPDVGLSLYRFSAGHGGVKCEGCHGSTHAEFPASHRNDNVQSIERQGHVGALVECTACHATTPSTVSGGPHGMHPVGASWVDHHPDAVETGGSGACRDCHGADYRGTELSRAQADRSLPTKFGTKEVWRGFQIGCYQCHLGPTNESANPNRAPVVGNRSVSTSQGTPVAVALVATDADGDALQLRIVSQPVHGTAGLAGTTATYFPDATFTGADSFTAAAWDGSTNSNLATVSVVVGAAATTSTTTSTTKPPTTTTSTTRPTTTSTSSSTSSTSSTSSSTTSSTTRTPTTTTSTTTTTIAAGTCPSPVLVPAAGGTFDGTTSGASAVAGTCGGSDLAPERVYQWTPSRSGVATIQTCSTLTDFDTVLYMRSGSCTSGVQVACGDNACLAAGKRKIASRIRPTVQAGTTYFIVVDGHKQASGRFHLTITPP